MRRAFIAAAVSAAVLLSACATSNKVGVAVDGAVSAYCLAVSEDGKVVLRSLLTNGRKVIACDEPAAIGATVKVVPAPPAAVEPPPASAPDGQ